MIQGRPQKDSVLKQEEYVQEMIILNTKQQPDQIGEFEKRKVIEIKLNEAEEQSVQSIKEKNERQFYPYYHGQLHWFITRLWFWHFFSYSRQLRNNVIRVGKRILFKHLPNCSKSEDIGITFITAQNYMNQYKSITCINLINSIFFGELKLTVAKIFLCYLIQGLVKCSISLIISSIISYTAQGDLETAYKITGGYVVVNLLGIMGQHHGDTLSMKFSSMAKMTLVNLIYTKLTQLSSYSIKEANIGKILNLASGDINSLVFITLFQCMVMPITMTYAALILWSKYGPIGLLAILILFIVYPIQIILQSFNSTSIRTAKQCADHRLKLTNELIEGIRLIKMYAWESAFHHMISLSRNGEFRNYLKSQLRTMIDRLLSLQAQIWGSYIFFCIVYFNNLADLDVAQMISTIQLLSFLKQSCVFIFSQAVQAIIMIRITFGRIISVLNIQNMEMTNISESLTYSKSIYAIELRDFTSYWKSNITNSDYPTLKQLQMQIEYGELWAVIGKIGSGKSTLLSAFLKEIPLYSGSLQIHGVESNKIINTDFRIAYVEQEPFIFPDSIRKNILFGKPYESTLYKRILQVSCLEQDLTEMKFQDFTEIGERGITLSGGQKARLALARALYQLADVYLFDDPLSAVDASVAFNIFHMSIKNFIFKEQPKLQPDRKLPVAILVTHQIQFAIECPKIAIISDGSILAQGSYEQIKNDLNMVNEELQKQLDESKGNFQKKEYIEQTVAKRLKINVTEINNLVGKEELQTQDITGSTYVRYFKYWNVLGLICLIFLDIGAETFLNFYIRVVSQYNEFRSSNDENEAFFILGMLILGLVITTAFKYLVSTLMVQTTTQKIHQMMLNQLIIAPVSYFDTNPSGRIINKFSNDLSIGDVETNRLYLDIQDIFWNFFIALITLAILHPYFFILIFFIIVVDVKFFMNSKKIVSQLKQIELQQWSPLFDFLKKTLGGVIQVRVYNQQEWFRKQFLSLTNKSNISSLTYYYSTRSFIFSIDITGYIVQFIGVFIILAINSNDIANLSQSLLLITIFNDSLQWGLKQLMTFETQMNSYNRMFQIIDIVPEAPHKQPIDETIYFPKDGSIEFQNVQMKYRSDTDLILKGLTFSIRSGEKIGCVGRTGAGKSSILQVLFRMTEIEGCSDTQLTIAGQDIRQLGLAKLRSNIGIIPQQPFLFTGTIRRNLDPFNQYSDDILWKALEDTDLKIHIQNLKEGLQTDMSDMNSVFSVGQKQLICLARTIINKKKIIVLDEATANVDMKTDDFIQQTLKDKFSECTLITIAHRLNTIADYDKVMVVSEGKALEYNTPYDLLAESETSEEIDKNTEFARLVKNTGPQNSMAIFQIAKQRKLGYLMNKRLKQRQ